jgi:DNA-directed RNA polymerase subunit RPC12/RpoP
LCNTETRQRLIAKMSGDGEPSAHPSDEAVCKQGVAEGNPLPEATPPAETNETVSNSTGTAPDHQLGRGEAPVRLSKCLVEFCRDKCPILPEDVEVIRASGQVRCPECNRKYLVHPTYAYSSGMGHVVRSCDGKFLHL